VEGRLVRIESDVGHVKGDVSAIKVQVKEVAGRLAKAFNWLP
jgi:hypothetical protein